MIARHTFGLAMMLALTLGAVGLRLAWSIHDSTAVQALLRAAHHTLG
jgi:hypothetical protein